LAYEASLVKIKYLILGKGTNAVTFIPAFGDKSVRADLSYSSIISMRPYHCISTTKMQLAITRTGE